MKSIKYIIKGVLICSISFLFASCDLDLVPVDNYSADSYWKTEAHFTSYMVGLRSNMRSKSFDHQFVLGEARGGSLKATESFTGVGTSYAIIKDNNIRYDNTGISNWGGLYGQIANVNLFIQRTEESDVLSENLKRSLLAQAYGIRAMWYFDLYRTYGSCPLQLEAKVVNGVIDAENLYEGRAEASTIMKQIKSDLKESLDYFGEDLSFSKQKSTWSKAATEALAADVYLWTAKVSTLDDQANPADIDVAKKHLLNLTTNYGLRMLSKFSDIFDAQKNSKGHAESIVSIRYAEGEASTYADQFLCNMQIFDGAYLYDNGKLSHDTLQQASSGFHRHEYKKEMFLNYDKEDSRRDATFLALYDIKSKDLLGTVLRKNIGYFSVEKNARIYCGDELWYRLAWVYLALAEVENFQGGDPAKYINMVRQRAYGDNWDEAKYGYKNADFTTNELAILKEKDKEFVSEGQRWWDVRRMTLTKGGKHLVFVPEGNVGSVEPILNEATEAHKVLWPIEVNMLNKDPLLTQTPGYE